MRTVELDQAKEMLPDLIEETLRGGEVLLTRNDTPVAKLIPVRGPHPARKAGSAKGLVWIADDFDEPLEDFEPYMR